MSTRRTRGSRQPELFARSTRPVIALEMNHRLVRLTEELDWTALEELVEAIRRAKLKNAAGRPPHLRALIGAVVLRATRRMTYRETEDQLLAEDGDQIVTSDPEDLVELASAADRDVDIVTV